VTATFTPATEYALTIMQAPGGQIVAAPGGPYYAGVVVSLTATPEAGYGFSAWGGDCAGQGNPCTLTMDGPKSVTATFTRNVYYGQFFLPFVSKQ
jgi:uncharacterized repeat protein (TIGR02543 family)